MKDIFSKDRRESLASESHDDVVYAAYVLLELCCPTRLDFKNKENVNFILLFQTTKPIQLYIILINQIHYPAALKAATTLSASATDPKIPPCAVIIRSAAS